MFLFRRGGVSGAVWEIRELFEPNRPYKKKGRLIYMRGVAGVAGYGVEAMPVNARENQKELKINNQLVNTKPKA